MSKKNTQTVVGVGIDNIAPVTRAEYLDCLRELNKLPAWEHARIGVLTCELSIGKFSSGHPAAPGFSLQAQHETDLSVLRRKCIGTMRAWVVRNIQDDASKAKQESMSLSRAEERAMVFFSPQFGGRKLVRYRGGKWAKPGIVFSGELPPSDLIGVGTAVLRRLALKGMVVLDEEKGEVTLSE